MLYSLAYLVVRLLLEVLIVRGRPNTTLRAEVLGLRHQLRVLERQVARPRRQPADRLLLAAISRALPRPAWRSLLPSPETLLHWHRELVRRKWAAYRRRLRRPRPVPRSELHELILRLARENARWGYRRIQGELLKLGLRCSHLTVRKVLRRHGLPPAPRRDQRSWRGFVRQHADQILAVHFFTVDTVWLTRLYVLFFTSAWVFNRLATWPGSSKTVSWRPSSCYRDSRFSAAFDEVFQQRRREGHPAALPLATGQTRSRSDGWGQHAGRCSTHWDLRSATAGKGADRVHRVTTTRLDRTKGSASADPMNRPA